MPINRCISATINTPHGLPSPKDEPATGITSVRLHTKPIGFAMSWLVEHFLMLGDWLFGYDPDQRI